jgi:hypothetical protein
LGCPPGFEVLGVRGGGFFGPSLEGGQAAGLVVKLEALAQGCVFGFEGGILAFKMPDALTELI